MTTRKVIYIGPVIVAFAVVSAPWVVWRVVKGWWA
jgi:hypothetical protein